MQVWKCCRFWQFLMKSCRLDDDRYSTMWYTITWAQLVVERMDNSIMPANTCPLHERHLVIDYCGETDNLNGTRYNGASMFIRTLSAVPRLYVIKQTTKRNEGNTIRCEADRTTLNNWNPVQSGITFEVRYAASGSCSARGCSENSCGRVCWTPSVSFRVRSLITKTVINFTRVTTQLSTSEVFSDILCRFHQTLWSNLTLISSNKTLGANKM